MVRKRDVLLLCMVAMHAALGMPNQGGKVNPSECRSLMDLYFVIDGSDSIDADNFKLLQEAVASMIPEIELGRNKARIGMLVYSSGVPLSSKHSFSYDPNYLYNAAMTLEHPRDGTKTSLAIQHMREIFQADGRKNVPWVCVVITDGISKNPPATIMEAKLAAKMGISMFAVGIGQKIAIKELEGIASTQNQVMAINDFSELRNILQSMMFRICPCPIPPVVPLAKCDDGPRAIGSVRSYQCMDGYLQRGNPTIQCQSDFTWTPLAQDFQCVPCSETTPFLEHGTCGGGDLTIGASRIYSCNLGYRGIGNPVIECLKDATWSTPKFECVPCGPPPQLPHANCGGDDLRIGAVRTYECELGYRLIGKKTIECMDNKDWLRPQWSKPDFKCVPCGETPSVQYGICGGGLDTIGAVRTFECEPGYRLIGKKTIECQDNIEWSSPRWSKPDFKCVPCGETPSVQYGICGGGLDTIGAVRTFECEPGYRLIGKNTIECQDNIEWPSPRWSKPDVQCVPCGDTPPVQHGICGGGLNTIGAVRTFECEPGYHLVGKKTIECLDNKEWPRPRWSEPDVQCIPCGKTPVVDFATCNEGENLIGSRRKYTCTEGYFMHGTPEIICLNDGTWSKPNLTCKDCGDPPRVPNAYTGTGPSLKGSKRVYYCESGFDMIGRGEIFCDGTGHWETPRFRCEGTSLKPLTTDPSVCDGCRYLNGVGYNHHPFDCNQYVQCFLGNKGLEPVFRKCPFGLFWDQNVLTCRPSHEVDCRQDRCKDLTVHSYKHADRDNCCAYWKCQGGKSYGECCGEGSSYDPVLQQCVTDYECVNECPFHDELPVCDKRPGEVDTMFEQHIGKNVWVPMDCAPGTVFNPVDCDCSLYLMTIPGKTRQQVCKPELYLPFTDGFNDRSGKNVFVKPENVSIRDGAAFFNGHSRIMINRFANTEFTGDLVIKFRYNEYKNGDYFNKLQALVTNGDCGSDPSIVVAKMPGYVLLGANTDTPKSFALPTLDKTWKEVIYIHNERKLEGRVCGAAMSKWSYGSIRATHCAVQIGYGNGLQSYVGLIDDLYIYQCRPRSSLLTINY